MFMTIIFYDKQKETYQKIGNIVQIEEAQLRSHGHLANFWLLTDFEGMQKSYPMKWFSIHKIMV